MSILIRYSLVGAAIGASFLNFISCGAQMYKASLQGDHPERNEELGSADSENPNSPEFGLHAPKGWVSLPITYQIEPNIDPIQLQAIQNAMTTWEKAVGRKLFTFNTTKHQPGSAFSSLEKALDDNLNGHYDQPDWKKTGKRSEVLATAMWINYNSDYSLIEKADIHYNSNYYFISDALTKKPKDDREIVDMQSLALHELGHLLGLSHVDDKEDSSSVMNKSMYIGQGLATRSLSIGDITRIQKIYGCEGKACDKVATAQEILLSAQKASAKSESGAH